MSHHAMLYEMLTGRVPFPADDPFVVASAGIVGDPPAPRSLNPSVSPQAEEIVLRALRRAPSERYPSVATMKDDVALIGILPVATQVALFGLLWRYFASHK